MGRSIATSILVGLLTVSMLATPPASAEYNCPGAGLTCATANASVLFVGWINPTGDCKSPSYDPAKTTWSCFALTGSGGGSGVASGVATVTSNTIGSTGCFFGPASGCNADLANGNVVYLEVAAKYTCVRHTVETSVVSVAGDADASDSDVACS